MKTKNSISIITLFVLTSYTCIAQVAIGTTDIDNSAILEIESNSRGFLMPRMTRAQKYNIATPAEGLCVYSTNSCEDGSLSVYTEMGWKNMPGCPDYDFDDDGVPNNIDIDDDNDGILDVLEQTTTDEKLRGTLGLDDNFGNNTPTSIETLSGFKYNTTPNGETSTVTWDNLRGFRTTANFLIQIQTFSDNNNNGNLGAITLNIPAPSQTSNPNSDVSSNPLVITNIDDDITFHIKTTTLNGVVTDINNVKPILFDDDEGTVTLNALPNNWFEIVLDKTAGPNIDFRMDIPGEYVTQYDIIIASSSVNDQFLIPLTRSLLVNLDNDNDGNFDHLDIDSDGDGCSDAFESESTTNSTPYFNYTNTDVGFNGLSNLIETDDNLSATNSLTLNTSAPYDNLDNTCP